MRLSERVALIGGEDSGDRADPDDCNVYAVRTSSGTLLVDAGVGRDIDHLIATAAADGVDTRAVAALLLTHAHLDHAGGAALLRRRLGARVLASPETARRLRDCDEDGISLPQARRAGMYRPDDRLRRCDVQRVVHDGDVLRFGDVTVRVMATPGHSADHVSYLLEADGWTGLFAGDLLFPGGMVALLNTHDCSLADLAASLYRLRDIRIDGLLAGHLQPRLSHAERDRDDALARLDALVFPRSIV